MGTMFWFLLLLLLYHDRSMLQISEATRLKCGTISHGKVVGGYGVIPSQHPWYVALSVPQNKKEIKVFCGSTLISSQFLISAAHCFDEKSDEEIATVSALFLLQDRCNGIMDDSVKLTWVALHPNYNPQLLSNDLSVAKLAKEVSYTPACLPSPVTCMQQKNPSGLWATVVGYGKESEAVTAEQPCGLRAGRVYVYRRSECLKTKTAPFLIRLTKTICAGLPNGSVDTCQGDSGGPLLIEMNGQQYVKGITSFGNGCGRPNEVGVYTSVACYIPWILKKAHRNFFQEIHHHIISTLGQLTHEIEEDVQI